jgi:hypothetical protein
VRSIFAAFERGDYSSAEWADPEIEYVNVEGPHAGRSTGLAGIAKAHRDFLSAREDMHIYADEYLMLDVEQVLVLTHRSGRGKTSGLELGQLRTGAATLFHIRRDK